MLGSSAPSATHIQHGALRSRSRAKARRLVMVQRIPPRRWRSTSATAIPPMLLVRGTSTSAGYPPLRKRPPGLIPRGLLIVSISIAYGVSECPRRRMTWRDESQERRLLPRLPAVVAADEQAARRVETVGELRRQSAPEPARGDLDWVVRWPSGMLVREEPDGAEARAVLTRATVVRRPHCASPTPSSVHICPLASARSSATSTDRCTWRVEYPIIRATSSQVRSAR